MPTSHAKSRHRTGKKTVASRKAPAKTAKGAASRRSAKATAPHQTSAPRVPPIVARPEKAARPAQGAVEKVDAKLSPAQAEAFRLVAIERAEPPSGAAGKNWYRYTIRQGVNAINGYLQGTAGGVKTAAEQIVGQLNERRAGRWGYRTTRAAAPAASG